MAAGSARRSRVVKALASALCIGGGGSVGREGPIVQIGSALASTLGQLVRMSEGRLRVIVACGAAGAIAATFNAPLTGMFFGFEIVLKEFSMDALAATVLSAVTADLISRAFFGAAPFFSAIPHELTVNNDAAYLLIALLGVAAGLLGVAFQKTLYRGEDAADALWGPRPQWLRPAVGGLLLGLVLLALPQMYGVGYPVMDRVLANHVVLWLVVILMAGKIFATSLTLWIGGSGGVFAPSLFIGAMLGTAFGIVAQHLFGASVGPPVLYGVVAMGGVFAARRAGAADRDRKCGRDDWQLHAHAPDHADLRDLLAGRQAHHTRQHLHHQTGTPRNRHRTPQSDRRAAGAHRRRGRCNRSQTPDGEPPPLAADGGARATPEWERLIGPVTLAQRPQTLFAEEDLEQARRQLVLYGRDGLPVVTRDGHLRGWLTRADVLKALATNLNA